MVWLQSKNDLSSASSLKTCSKKKNTEVTKKKKSTEEQPLRPVMECSAYFSAPKDLSCLYLRVSRSSAETKYADVARKSCISDSCL